MRSLAPGAKGRLPRRVGIVALGLASFTAYASACGGPEFELATSGDGGLGADGSMDATASGDATSQDATGGDVATSGGDSGDAAATSSDGGDAAATSSDGGDGATAGYDAGDGGPANFSCAALASATVAFCSDFDEQTTPPWGWSSEPVFGHGSVAVDTTDRLSPPNAFAASNTAFLTGTATVASLGESFISPAGRIDYAFEMFVKQYDTVNNPELPVAQLTIGPSTASAFSLELSLKAGTLSLVQLYVGTDGGEQMPSAAVGSVSTGAWVHVEMLLDRTSVNWTVTVFLNGVSKLTAQTPVTPSNQDLEVDLGILEVLAPTTANAVTFDNVLVRAY